MIPFEEVRILIAAMSKPGASIMKIPCSEMIAAPLTNTLVKPEGEVCLPDLSEHPHTKDCHCEDAAENR
jgi:hypothetical protein